MKVYVKRWCSAPCEEVRGVYTYMPDQLEKGEWLDEFELITPLTDVKNLIKQALEIETPGVTEKLQEALCLVENLLLESKEKDSW